MSGCTPAVAAPSRVRRRLSSLHDMATLDYEMWKEEREEEELKQVRTYVIMTQLLTQHTEMYAVVMYVVDSSVCVCARVGVCVCTRVCVWCVCVCVWCVCARVCGVCVCV